MKSRERNALYPVLDTLERLARGSAPGAALIDQQALQRLRADLKKQLLALRSELGQILIERDCYLILFPIVVCLDELVQVRHATDQTSWSLLQREFFNVDQGGQLFYTTLDEILDGPRAAPIIYEAFYFCLNVGFRGRYTGDEERAAAYMTRIRTKFDEARVEDRPEPVTAVSGLLKPTRSHFWLYLAVLVLLTVVYFALRSAAQSDPARPQLGAVQTESIMGATLETEVVPWACS